MPEKGPFNNMQIPHSVPDRKAALAVANEMKADFVIFVDHEENKEGALIEPHCGSLFHVSVNVRGLSVKPEIQHSEAAPITRTVSISAARHIGT